MSDLESLLRERLARVTEPELPPPPGLAEELRRRHDRRLRRLVAGTVGLAACAVGAVVLMADALDHNSRTTLHIADAPERPTASPMPGVSPSLEPPRTGGAQPTAPAQVLAAAARARAETGGVPVRVVWVRTTWGMWRSLEGQNPGRQATTPVYIVQAAGEQPWVCRSCKGVATIMGSVSTTVFGVANPGVNEFVLGSLTFGVPDLPGVTSLN